MPRGLKISALISATRKKIAPYIPLLGYVLFACLIAFLGFNDFRKIENLIEAEKLDDLGEIADIKVRQIVSWQEREKSQAESLARGSPLASEFGQWLLEAKPSAGQASELVQALVRLQLAHAYQAVSLLDRQGALKATTGKVDSMDGADVKLALAAMNGRHAVISDIHKHGAGKQLIGLSLAAPLIDGNVMHGRVVGALLLHIDPYAFLYPLIQLWPKASLSAETLLTRQEGSEVVFINDLRFRKGAALSLRVPLSMTQLPTVMALRGETVAIDGVDYRGVPVVAAMRKVPGTTWFMISKMDRDEIFAPIERIKKGAEVLGLAFSALGGFFFFVWLQGVLARQKQLKSQHDAALERELLLRHFEYLTRFANDIIIVTDTAGRIVEANERAQQDLGYSREALLEKNFEELNAPRGNRTVPGKIEKLMRDGSLREEGLYRRKDGSVFPVEISARVIEVQGATFLQNIIRDISERKAAERRILRLNNLYAAISRANEAIVQIRDRGELFHEICRIAVEYGQFKLAWIGLVDEATQTIKVAAFSGEASGYLDGIDVSIDAGKPEGRGPAGISQRENREIVCNDFLAESHTLPWQEKAEKFGLRSSASCPLELEGRVLGGLHLYADEKNYFDQELANLLSDLARDISLALDRFMREDRRREIEVKLQRSEERFRFLAENSSDMVYRMTLPDGCYEYVSPASEKLFGYLPEDFYRSPLLIRSLVHPSFHAYFSDQWEKLVGGEMPPSYEYQIVHKSGETRWMLQRNSAVRDSDGKLIAIQGLVSDISEQKRSEQALRESEARFRNLADNALALIWLSDTENMGAWFSKGWLEYTGRTMEQEQGLGWIAGVHPDDLPWCVPYCNEAFKARRKFEMEFRLRRADGCYGWVSDTGIPRFSPDGEFEGYVGYCWDITEHKQFEELRAKLEHAARLNVAGEMASGMAHELSQPLTACANYLDGCLRRMEENDWNREKLHKAVKLAHKQADRAGQIINHLKDLMRKQGHERTLIDVNFLAREVTDFLEDEVRRHGVTLTMTLSPLPLVMACRIEIEQVLLNLYKNAIEAMHASQQRELRVSTRITETGDVLVVVGDTGCGISPSEIKDLFHPFKSSKQEGLGLGLAICRTSIENHGGRIWADLQRELGAEFCFTLPASV